MQQSGGALLAIGTGSGPDRIKQAIEKALHHPLLEEIDLYSSTHMIANFTGSANISFRDVTDALQLLQEASGFQAEIIPGVITDARMDDRVQLILIVTGIGVKKNNPARTQPEMTFREPAAPAQAAAPTPQPAYPDKTSMLPGIREVDTSSLVGPRVDQDERLDVPAFLRRRSFQPK
jgi:cell division protein FtsZ